MTSPYLWKPPPGGKCNAFLHHAFYSSCEALDNSVFNCYRALWAGTDRFLSFRTFYSVLEFFKFTYFLQHTGTIYSVLELLMNLSYPVLFNFSLRLWSTPMAKLHYLVCTCMCPTPVPHKALASKVVLRIKCTRKAIKKKSCSRWMWTSKPGWFAALSE